MMRNKDKSQEEDSSLHSNASRVAWNALSSEAYKCTVQIMICFTFVGVPH
uniref:Chromodomain helicase DNA binding protein 2 n=2 Tax=Equus TaxID=9789 RepID=A0A9L0RWX0_HORSE